MAGSVNKAILIGNVGKEPEIRSLPNGDRVANFSLATSESWRDKASGERREKTEWHNIVIFNENLVRIVEQYVKKGSKIYIEGQLQTRKYQDKNGQDRWVSEIVLNRFRGELNLLDSRGSDGGFSEQKSFPSQDDSRSGAAQASDPFGGTDGIDDEIPF